MTIKLATGEDFDSVVTGCHMVLGT